MLKFIIASLVSVGAAQTVSATETTTYAYDALGRVTAVTRTGTVNNGQQTIYGYDAADNRTSVTTTGASH